MAKNQKTTPIQYRTQGRRDNDSIVNRQAKEKTEEILVALNSYLK